MTFEELNIVRTLKKQIADEEQKLQGFKDLAQSITPQFDRITFHKDKKAISYTCLNIPSKSNKFDSRIETIATLIVDTENIIDSLKKQLDWEMPLLTQKIKEEFTDPVSNSILIYRYVFCRHFRDIGNLMNYSESRIYFFHQRLMKQIKSQ